MDAANATEQAEDAGNALRMKLEFSVWRKSFDRAHTAWTNAPAELKSALLLSGADLARAESWLVDFSDKLTDSERRYILKSKMLRLNPHAPGAQHVPKRRGALYYLKIYSGPMLSVAFVAVLIAIRVLAPQVEDEAVVEKPSAEPWLTRGIRFEARKTEPPVEKSGEKNGEKTTEDLPRPDKPPTGKWPSPGKSAVERLAQTPPASQPQPSVPMLAVPTSGPSRLGQKVAHLEEMARYRWDAGEKDVALRFAVEALGSALEGRDSAIRAEAARSMVYRSLSRKAGDAAKPSAATGDPATLACPGGERILISTETRRLQRWQIEPPLHTGQIAGSTAALEAAGVDRACDRIAVPGEEHSVEILSLTTGRRISRLEGHEAPVVASAFNPDGSIIATASGDKTVRLWDVASGRLRKVLDAHEGAVAAVAFSPDGRLLVTGSDDMTTRVWDARSGRELHRLAGHTGPVDRITFLGETHRTLTVSKDGTAAIWDADTGERLRQLNAASGSIVSIAADVTGNTVAAASDNGRVRVWQTSGDRSVDISPAGGEPLRALMLSDGGRMLLTLDWDGTAQLWNAVTGDGVARIGGTGARIVAAGFRPDGKQVTSLLGDGALASWPVIESSNALLRQGREALPGCRAGEPGSGGSRPAWCGSLVQSGE